jgi:hypothetical protein
VSASQPLTGDELATIKARAEAACERSDPVWENEARLGQVWTVYNDEDSLIHMPRLNSPLGEHIAGMDPETTLRLVAEVEQLRAELHARELHHFETEEKNAALTEEVERLRAARDEARGKVHVYAEEVERLRAERTVEREPGRWWRVMRDDRLWCETSDEHEARESLRPGDKLYRWYVYPVAEGEWRQVT